MSCCNSNCNHDPCGSSFNQKLTMAAQYASYAQTQAVKAENLWEEFNALYLGAFAVAPTQDNEGNPLQVGALYWNSVTSDMWVWDGSAWTPDAFNEFTPFLATGTPTARNLVTRTSDIYNVKDFGAIGNGVFDCQSSFQAAINAALAAGGGTIYIPKGIYNFPNTSNSTKLDPGLGNLTFKGDGYTSSILKYWEGTGNDQQSCLFSNTSNNPSKGSLIFQDLQIQGSLGTRSGRFGNPLYCDHYPEVIISKCKFYNIAAMASDFHYCKSVKCLDSFFENIAADGIRARDCFDFIVIGNKFTRIGDDAIANHTATPTLLTFTPQRERIIICNNTIVNAQQFVRCIATKKTIITGNTIHLAGGIDLRRLVEFPAGTIVEGGNPVYEINISNNSFTDPWTLGAPGWIYIQSNVKGGTSTNNIIPGDYNSTTLDFVFPWNYTQTDITAVSNSLPRTFNVSITNNTFSRTRSAVPAFSDYGYGSRMSQGFSTNPPYTDSDLTYSSAIYIDGQFENFLISGNVIKDTVFGIRFVPHLTADANDSPSKWLKNGIVSNNTIFNCNSFGIHFNVQSAVLDYNIDILITGNSINCDPYRVNPNSNNNGTYIASSDIHGVSLQWAKGVKVLSNTFKNCSQAVQGFNIDSNVILNNIVHCSIPAGVGFNVGNKGIGDIVINRNHIYVIEDSDPTSATYLKILQETLFQSTSMPSTGWYHQGWFVKNSNPALDGNGMTISGWIRLTTGTAHVAGVDWAVARVSNVSPAV